MSGDPTTARAVAAGLVAAIALAVADAPRAQELRLPGGPAEERPAGAAPGSVDPETDPARDRTLETRLREIYAQVEGLSDVAVSVNAGVVRLSGEVLSGTAAEKAERIARQLQGVVEVESDVREVRDLERRLRPALGALSEKLAEGLAFLPLLLIAALAFAAFVALGRAVTAWERPYARLARSRFARDLLRQVVRVGFVLAGALVALDLLDATAFVAAVAGAAGLAGLALGFAFRDLAENTIASVLLSLRQPFLPNDHVVIEGFEGHVVRLTSRATILIGLDGNHVRIPNAVVFKGILVNYTRSPRRRFDFALGVDAGTDLAAAVALGIDTLDRMPGVLSDPPPQGWVRDLGDWNAALHFFGWIDQRQAEWAKARGEAIRLVKEAFDAAGIAMPEPLLNVRTHAGAPAPAAPPRRAAAEPTLELDIAPDTHLAREVAEDRAEEGGDLLDPNGPRE